MNYGKLDIIRLAMILAKHKICYSTETCNVNDIKYDGNDKIIFEMQ